MSAGPTDRRLLMEVTLTSGRVVSIWTAGAEEAGQATRTRQAEGWLNLGSVDSGACGALGDQPPKLLSKAPSEVAQSVLY